MFIYPLLRPGSGLGSPVSWAGFEKRDPDKITDLLL